MKKLYSYLWLILLITYSIVLMFVEIKTSQDFVRNFFADIQGDVPFYAVNTTLTVFLLWATSLMFQVNLALSPIEKINASQVNFYRSQACFFCYLGFDERFLIHEKIGYVLGINDALIILGLGIIELVFIASWGNYQKWSNTTRSDLLRAAICFSLMVVMDGAFPQDMVLRLSLEDLAKTWANVFLFLFSWNIFSDRIAAFKRRLQNLNC
ncbi:MAG: hypothetical protein RLZZ04_1789 [Cyanobacteriota bacterium]|jgi:hypothetical protein